MIQKPNINRVSLKTFKPKCKYDGIQVGSLVLLVVLMFPIFTFAKNLPQMQLDQFLKRCSEIHLFNGCVLVAQGNKIILHGAYGVSDFTQKTKLDPDFTFRLASVSKTFTAMAVMMLTEEGRIAYSDKVVKYLPNLPYTDVTVEHLLRHTSGIPNYVHLFNRFWDSKPNKGKNATSKDVLEFLVQAPPALDFAPGDKYQYSNTGYVLLALIVEKVSGSPFGQFLSQRIFAPLQMQNTYLYRPEISNTHRAHGFAIPPDGSIPVENDHHFLNGVYGDGSVCSTVMDLYEWDRALYTEKLVSRNTLKKAFSKGHLNNNQNIDFGFGWKIEQTSSGHKAVGHQGGWVGFRTKILRDLENHSVLIILTNDTNEQFEKISNSIENLINGRNIDLLKQPISWWIGRMIREKGLKVTVAQYRKDEDSLKKSYDLCHERFERLGLFYIQQGKYEMAKEVFQLNLETNSSDYRAYNSLGRACLYAKEPEMAISLFKKSMVMNPDADNLASQLLENMRKKAPSDKQHLFE